MFGYDGAQISSEWNWTPSASPSLLRRYVHGPGVDEPVVWYEGSGTADRRWLHADERGSVIAVSDAAGNALAINRYDEYGIPQSGNLGRFQFTGQAWLPELGMYYYKARMYSATLGRFMQTDPIGYDDGINWYNYVGGDPVNFTDPTGAVMCAGSRTPQDDCNDVPGWSPASSIVLNRLLGHGNSSSGGGGRLVLSNSGSSVLDSDGNIVITAATYIWVSYSGALGLSLSGVSPQSDNCQTSGVNDLVKNHKNLADAVARVRANQTSTENEFGFEAQINGRAGVSVSDINQGIPGEVTASKWFTAKNGLRLNFGALYFHSHGPGYIQNLSAPDVRNGDGFGEAMTVLITPGGLQCSRSKM